MSLLHDIGKTKELSRFPRNDYTEEGQFIEHALGVEVIECQERVGELEISRISAIKCKKRKGCQ